MYRYIIAAAALAIATPAQAVFVEYAFTGQVQSDPNDNIRFSNGADRYTGPETDFPVAVGDMLTVAFQTFLPIRFGPPPADGIYRFAVTGNDNSAPVPRTTVTVNGSLDNKGKPTFGLDPFGSFGYGLIYDSNPGIPDGERLTIDLRPSRGNISDGEVSSVLRTTGYVYDPAENAITATDSSRRGQCNDFDRDGCSALKIGKFSATLFDIPFLQEDSFVPGRLYRRGRFGDINFTGQWNVPVITSADEVPAPPVVLLFGAAAGALAWRRRKSSQWKPA